MQYSNREPGRYLLLGAVSVFALALRPRTYLDESGGIQPLSAVRNADLLCPLEQGRCFTAARTAFVRWILAQAAEYELSIGHETVEIPIAPYSSDEDEDCESGNEERDHGPTWVPIRYQAVFCQLVQFASGIVATHIRINKHADRLPFPSRAFLIERLSLDFGYFFGHHAQDYLRHQLNEVQGRLNQNPDDERLRHFLLRTMIAHRDPILSWNPPPVQAEKSSDEPPSPAPWDEPPTAYLDGLRNRQHVQEGRCLFDMVRWYAWRELRESLLPVLQIETPPRGFMANQEVINMYDHDISV